MIPIKLTASALDQLPIPTSTFGRSSVMIVKRIALIA
jgi:hypothetical protein